ncbi:hypothetical protein SRB5_30150 [Streptomyces sp. RB5]|uniref:Uncharacterized protein n=1 Tax=Streptomyces smaragdinus TaxID=2585196 RepID=A0A7K0CHI6_9ACTN|nr:hypothetical protein [Streptomyces smaragdinus]MQY12876.1 hypothetical protein [Streptomyces smaragdinus]
MPDTLNPAARSLVARCLLDPGYLERFARAPQEELAALEVGAEARTALAGLDAERVRLFAGFVAKVQHNDLWDDFPLTRALLRYYGAELTTFADYRPHQLELARAGKPSRAARTAAFLDFLTGRLRDPARPRHPGLLAVLTHERLHQEVTRSIADGRVPAPGRPAPGPVRAGGRDPRVVVARDVLRVAALDHDPRDVAARLRDGGRELPGLAPDAVCLCYWGRVDPGTVSVLTVDPPVASVLAAVDGRRSVHEVLDGARATLPEAGRRELARVLDTAVERGLVQLTDNSAALG